MQGASEQADPEDTSRPTNRKYKVVLLGEVNVGKTSLFQRIRLGRHQEWGTTVGVDQYTKEFIIDGAHISLQIWDTAGSEKYRTLTANYYHSAAACIYVYDLGAQGSLYSLSTWADDARRFEPRHVMFLVGNKCDLKEEDIALEESTIQAFNAEMEFKLDAVHREVNSGAPGPRSSRAPFGQMRQAGWKCRQRSCWRVSAQTGADVERFFEHVARTLVERSGGVTPHVGAASNITGVQEAPPPKKCCG